MKAMLVLEDGTLFEGDSTGPPGEKVGEVMLHTAVVGYQEIATDPANAGRIVVLTYPLVGNYGTADKFNESCRAWAQALITKENSAISSNWQAEDTFSGFLKRHKMPALSQVDTRTLAVRIRDKGEMWGIVSSGKAGKGELLKRLKQHKKNIKRNFIRDISVKKMTNIKSGRAAPRIGVLDLGVTNDLLTQLKTVRCGISILPFNTDAEKILSMNLDGLIISSGPEDDESIPGITRTVKELIGKIPMLGISLGHELIGLALGAKRKRMKVGHHGVNYPVRSPESLKGEITVQNHSYVLDEAGLSKIRDVKITLRNLNDQTIEEMESKKLKFISTQYIPASPGLNEVHDTLKRFIKMASGRKGS